MDGWGNSTFVSLGPHEYKWGIVGEQKYQIYDITFQRKISQNIEIIKYFI